MSCSSCQAGAENGSRSTGLHTHDATCGAPTPLLRGVVYIHSCPRALLSHVEWALANILGPGARPTWSSQPVLSGTKRADLGFKARPGTAAKVVSELRAFPGLRFEVTQEPGAGFEGERYAYTPSLGVFRSAMGPHGDVLINEERLRAALGRAGAGMDLADEVHKLLGTAWDTELEAFRYAGEDSVVRWMHEVG